MIATSRIGAAPARELVGKVRLDHTGIHDVLQEHDGPSGHREPGDEVDLEDLVAPGRLTLMYSSERGRQHAAREVGPEEG